MNSLFAIAWNGFREARRNRVTVVVGVFLGALLLASQLVTEVTVSTFDRVLTDFGLGSMGLILVFLSIFLSTGLLSREIERKTIYLVVTKPVSRTTFLLGRVAGNMVTLTLLLAFMSVLFFIELRIFGADVTRAQLLALGGLWVELLIITGAGVLLSTFAGPMVSSITVVGLYLVGHLSPDLYSFAARSETAAFRVLGKALYYGLPNLDRLNFRPQAAYQLPIDASAYVSALLYGLGWAAVFLALGSVIFNRRDFK